MLAVLLEFVLVMLLGFDLVSWQAGEADEFDSPVDTVGWVGLFALCHSQEQRVLFQALYTVDLDNHYMILCRPSFYVPWLNDCKFGN